MVPSTGIFDGKVHPPTTSSLSLPAVSSEYCTNSSSICPSLPAPNSSSSAPRARHSPPPSPNVCKPPNCIILTPQVHHACRPACRAHILNFSHLDAQSHRKLPPRRHLPLFYLFSSRLPLLSLFCSSEFTAFFARPFCTRTRGEVSSRDPPNLLIKTYKSVEPSTEQ